MIHQHELEWKLIYSVIVAGKSAVFTKGAMKRLLPSDNGFAEMRSPFRQVRNWIKRGVLAERLREARTGNYTKLQKCLEAICHCAVDLRTCRPQELEQYHGIGPKTSRFFILWTRKNARYAALDVHILRWMAGLGIDVPKQTPQSSSKYLYLEQLFIAEADKRKVLPGELDHAIWIESSNAFVEERNERTAKLIRPV